MTNARINGWLVVASALGMGIAVGAGCTSFGAAEVPADGGPAADTAGDGGADAADAADAATAVAQGVRCGSTRCPAPSVCCFEADGGAETCTTKESCPGAPLACTTTFECVDAGAPAGSVCCAYNDAKKLVRATCVQGSACDAKGPQDWVCDPTLAPDTQCTDPARPRCVEYPFAAPADFALCAQ